jgi:hypothetical protein
MRTRYVLAVLAAVVLAGPTGASATNALSDAVLNLAIAKPTLKVNARGIALVEYRTNGGLVRHVLAWGAVNGLSHPIDPPTTQQKFRFDYSGGWKSQKNARYWRTFKNACRDYDGPTLVMLVAACKAPDGSYWALQAWQKNLPIRGIDPWTDFQRSYELHLSHWSGELPVLEIYQQWTYGGANEGFFGRMVYKAEPVFGRRGPNLDTFARQVYIDTLNAPKYGSGWRRETSISMHVRNGAFCYTFVAQAPPGGYPSGEPRGPGIGERYRMTAMGPGVTPIVQVEQDRIGKVDDALRAERQKLFDQILGGDAHCKNER